MGTPSTTLPENTWQAVAAGSVDTAITFSGTAAGISTPTVSNED